MRRFRAALAAASIAALVTVLPAQAATGPRDPSSDASASRPTVDTSSALVQLKGDPLSTYVKTKPAPGKKIDFGSTTAKSYRAQLSALRNDFKKWLQANAPKAQVVGQYDISLNAVAVRLNGTSLATLRTAPQVVRAEYEGLYYPTAEDPDLSLISAQAAWATAQVGGTANAGKGVKVAIVDTGIDQTHPCFSDAGYPSQTQRGDTRFTNNKVIVAKVFSNKVPSRHFTPEALQEHGTHVAGTVACNYGTAATVSGATIPYGISGVAPRALLGNYNIFPGDDQTGITNARSEDIVNALEAAYSDGMDIANMSLGGGASGIKDLLTMAVDDLDQAGMVIAVAAGNSAAGNAVPPHTQAPGHYTVESPGSAARALTAGASTVGHFVATPLTVGGHSYAAVPGDFPTVTSNLTAPLGVVLDGAALSTACAALPAGSLSGKIALISRGGCTFSQKIRDAQDAGAVAAIVVNNVAGDPTAMARGGIANEPTIPAYMVGLADKAALIAANGQSATIGATNQYFVSGNDDIMAAFSSQGPTDVDFRVKPDVVAPGVNVLSSIPHQFCDAPPCFAFFQGTSMATPHLAGSAAVVKAAHPDWSSAQIRSAIVNTADQGVLTKSSAITTVETDVNIVGSGRENLLSAVNAKVALDPVSVSFGAVPSGAGQTATRTVSVSNLGGSATGATVSGATSGGVTFSASLSNGKITVTMNAAKGAALGDHQAILRVTNGGTEVAHAVVYVFVK